MNDTPNLNMDYIRSSIAPLNVRPMGSEKQKRLDRTLAYCIGSLIVGIIIGAIAL